MPDQQDQKISQRKVSKISSGIQSLMDNIYKKTYYSTSSIDSNISALTNSINKSIDNIINTNKSLTGIPNVSKLYTRVADGNSRNEFGKTKDISTLFEDRAIMDGFDSVFLSNSYIKEMDDEIDAICKYMPKLQEALDTKQENVLCAEHFSKDFLTLSCGSEDIDGLFKQRSDAIKTTYNLLQFVTDVYDHTAKYGEDFIYVVPYSKALSKLLAHKNSTQSVNINMESAGITFTESGNIVNKDKLVYYTESTITDNRGNQNTKLIENNLLSKDEHFGFRVDINTTNIIESAVMSKKSAISKLDKINESSLFFNESEYIYNPSIKADADTEFKRGIEKDTDITGNLSFNGVGENRRKNNNLDFSASDGLITERKYKIKVPGCVLKRLDHQYVKPLYIDDMCLGYYYLEINRKDAMTTQYGLTNMMADPMVSSNNNKMGTLYHNIEDDKQDEVLRYLSSKLSEFIDKKFINDNQDLRQEIYMILKTNDIFNSPDIESLKVTFIPPDEMIHTYFKMDPITHRGISDLEMSLMPAKIYCSLYLTNTMQNLTRGYDKRVYYVKQTVESNIAKTLLNTITQIKQNDMNIRHFRSINTILGITGRFNDYIIPENASGESPIRMETIQGNPAQADENLMNSLEEMAVNATDVPIELIQARQSMQFATEYSMSSIKFLRKVYKRQSQYEIFLSTLITKLYNEEYEDSNLDIKVTLPPPVFLNITNSTQVIENAKAFVSSIVEMDLGQNPDQNVAQIYTKKLMRNYVGTYIDIDKNEELLNAAKMEAKTIPQNQDDNGNNMMM